MHPRQHRDPSVHVVMHLDSRLALNRPEDAANVLNDPATECNREGNEKRVQGRAVKPLAQEAPRRDQHNAIARLRRCQTIDCRPSFLLASPSDQDVWANAKRLEPISDQAYVLLPLRQDQAVATRLDRRRQCHSQDLVGCLRSVLQERAAIGRLQRPRRDLAAAARLSPPCWPQLVGCARKKAN